MSTKKATPAKAATPKAVKAAPAPKVKKLRPIEDVMEELEEELEGGKIEMILALFIKGYTRKQIIEEAGFNKTTVYRQVGEYVKMKKGPIMEFHGHDMYEARVQRVMKSKSCSRDKAIDFITQQDMKSGLE